MAERFSLRILLKSAMLLFFLLLRMLFFVPNYLFLRILNLSCINSNALALNFFEIFLQWFFVLSKICLNLFCCMGHKAHYRTGSFKWRMHYCWILTIHYESFTRRTCMNWTKTQRWILIRIFCFRYLGSCSNSNINLFIWKSQVLDGWFFLLI